MRTDDGDGATPIRDGMCRPGWPEMLVGLLVLALGALGGGVALARSGIDPVALGLALTALSGIAGLAAFAAAFLLRLKSWGAFGIRWCGWRWIAIGAGLGVAAFIIKSLAILAWTGLTGDSSNIQSVYATGGGGGWATLVAATLFLSVLTPIGEEFLFRGVVTNALLRYGAVIGVLGGALIFALFHGVNPVFPAAVVVGIAAGEVFRRSGSIWPAVTVHLVVNLPTVPVMVLAGVG